jgi:hypothetical protein
VGADLILSMTEIKRGRQPDWGAAQDHLAKLSTHDCYRIIEEVQQYGYEIPTQEEIDQLRKKDAEGGDLTNDEQNLLGLLDDLGDDPKGRLQSALDSCKSGWEGGLRMMSRMRGHYTDILIGGGVSWGDSIDECTDIQYFVASGCAKAAGFLDKGSINFMSIRVGP